MPRFRCRFCDHDNPEGARFCNSCGSPLHLKPCPQCEAVNQDTATKCYQCGASFGFERAPEPVLAEASAIANAPAVEPTPVTAKPEHVPESLAEQFAFDGSRFDYAPRVDEGKRLRETDDAPREPIVALGRDPQPLRRSALFTVLPILALAVVAAGAYYEYTRRSSVPVTSTTVVEVPADAASTTAAPGPAEQPAQASAPEPTTTNTSTAASSPASAPAAEQTPPPRAAQKATSDTPRRVAGRESGKSARASTEDRAAIETERIIARELRDIRRSAPSTSRSDSAAGAAQ